MVLLLWVYYSSLILYFGAEFTKAYAVKYGSNIYPNHYAVTTKMVEVETGSASVQDKEDCGTDTKGTANGQEIIIKGKDSNKG